MSQKFSQYLSQVGEHTPDVINSMSEAERLQMKKNAKWVH